MSDSPLSFFNYRKFSKFAKGVLRRESSEVTGPPDDQQRGIQEAGRQGLKSNNSEY
jgi:hypothetical protein